MALEVAHAQSITVDPSSPRANRPAITRSGAGKPQINIVTPKAGVSHNRYGKLSTNAGAIFNNATTSGTSRTGGSVAANPNLRTSGTAKVIVNEVRGAGRSTVKGQLEVFGAKADVIIANENGITCDGCSFVNTGRATLSSGRPQINGSSVALSVRKGSVNIGRGGVSGADTINLSGRHVIIDGKVQARDRITASGGAQIFDPARGTAKPAPSDQARQAPYAVDATAFGSMTAGNIRVIGNESGLGVRLDGRMTAGRDLTVTSRGDLSVRNFKAGRNATLSASGNAQQLRGTGEAGANITVSARRFATSPGAKLVAGNVASIRTNDTLTIAGEVRAKTIKVTTQKATVNLGQMISAQELTIVAGEITNRRSVKETKTKIYAGLDARYIPWMLNYTRLYNNWLATYYRGLLSRAERTVTNQQTLGPAALIQGRDVSLTSTIGDVLNESTIRGTNSLKVSAKRDILNRAQMERDRQPNGTYKTTYHAAGINAPDMSLYAGRNLVQSRAGLGGISKRLSINVNSSLGVWRDFTLSDGLVLISRGGKVTNDKKSINAKGTVHLAGRTGVTSTGRIIAGVDARLMSSAGGVYQRSRIDAERDITVQGRGNVDTGELRAKRNLKMVSTAGNVINRYVAYGYNTLNVSAFNDVINQGYKSRHSYMYGGNGASLTAGRNIVFNGGRLWSYRDINIKSGNRIAGSVLVSGLETRTPIKKYSGRPYATEVFTSGSTGAWVNSIIDARGTGNLSITAARGNIAVTGSQLIAGGNVKLDAAGTISLATKNYSDAIRTTTRKWYTYKKRRWFRTRTYWAYRDSVANSGTKRYAGSAVTAGKNLWLGSGQNLSVAGGMKFGGDFYAGSRGGVVTMNRDITTGGKVTLSGRKGVVNNKTIDAKKGITLVSSGGGISNKLKLASEGSIYMRAAGDIDNYDARARQHLTMISTGGNVKNRGVAYGYNTLTVDAWGDVINQGYASRHSNMYGGYGVTLTAGANVRINGAKVWSYRDIIMEAGRRTNGSVIITGVETRTPYARTTGQVRGTQVITTGTTGAWRGALIDARGAGNIFLSSKRGNVEAWGSDLKAGGNIGLSASSSVKLYGKNHSDRFTQTTRRWYSYRTGALWWRKTKWAYRDTSKSLTTNRWAGTTLTADRVSFGRTPNVFFGAVLNTGSPDLRLDVWNNLTMEGTHRARDIILTSQRGVIRNRGTLTASRNATLYSVEPSYTVTRTWKTTPRNAILNEGRVQAGRAATLIGSRGVTTSFVIARDIDIRAQFGGVKATGALVAGKTIDVDARGTVETRGVIADDVNLTSRRGGITARGWTAADGSDWKTGKQVFANRMADEFEAGTVTQGDVANRKQAVVHARENLNIASAGKLSVLGGATLSSTGDLEIGAGGIDVISTWTGTTLLRSAILAGGDLTLNVAGALRNTGGTISAKDNLFVNATGSIVNDGIKTTFVLTRAMGCDGSACGKRWGFTWSPAELLAGSGMVLTSGASVFNRAGQIAAAGSLTIHARDGIRNEDMAGQFRIVDIYKKKCFIICYSKTVRQENRAVIDSAVIQTEYGDITLITDRGDIFNRGSFLSAGGDLTLQAGRDVTLRARSFEVHNLYKKRGFSGFLTYSSNKTYWNNFATALSQLEGMNVTLSADRDVGGIGATIMALNDVTMVADRDVMFDAKQNTKYLIEKGWSFGLTSSNFRLTQGVIQSGDFLQAYIQDNPALAAVHELATAEDGWGALNGTLALVWHGSQSLANANGIFRKLGGQSSVGGALAKQFIPKDFEDFQGLIDNCTRGGDLRGCAAAAGIGFRFEMWESRKEWTESHVSRIGAGNDLLVQSGRDVAFVGGTIASAGRHVSIDAGRDFLMSAVADNSRTRSSGWGLNIGIAANGITVGGHANGAKSEQTIYSNATLTAARRITIDTGRDAKLLGAVIRGRTIFMDVGRDLWIASRQNTSSNTSWGFNASVTFNGGSVTGFSLGGSYGRGSRAYTDTPTWIEATHDLDIYVRRATYLMGAVLYSRNNKLKLDTGTFVFDHFRDHDRQVNVGGSISFGGTGFRDVNGNFNALYRNKQGITYATVAGGDVRVRSNPRQNLSQLNTNINTVHRVTKNVYINIKIPGINLKLLRQNLEEAGNFLRAATADIPDQVRAQGGSASRIYQRMLANGLSAAQAQAIARTPEFREAVRLDGEMARAIEVYGSFEAVPRALKIAIASGEKVLYRNVNGNIQAGLEFACDTSGTGCFVRFGRFDEEELFDPDAIVARARAELERIIPELERLRGRTNLTSAQRARLAQLEGQLVQQMSYYALCSENPGDLLASGLIPNDPFYANPLAIAAGYREGGDDLAEQFPTRWAEMEELRRTNPQFFFTVQYLKYHGFGDNAFDAMFLLRGASQTSNQNARFTMLQTAASLTAGLDPISGVNVFTNNQVHQAMYGLRMAAEGLSPVEKLIYVASVDAVWSEQNVRVAESVRRARILTAALLGGAIAAEVAPIVLPAILNCVRTPLCRAEQSVLLAELAAGDALGGASLMPIVAATGTVALRNGDEVIALIDNAGNLFARPAGVTSDQFIRALNSPPNGIAHADWVQVLMTPRLSRPPVGTYMSQAQIDAHLALFDGGAVRFFFPRTGTNTIGPENAFVFPRSYLEDLYRSTGGNIRAVEQRLGLPSGYLDNAQAAVITNPNVRVPTGNEAGALPDYWLPGGYTSGGAPEGVIPGQLTTNSPGVTVVSAGDLLRGN